MPTRQAEADAESSAADALAALQHGAAALAPSTSPALAPATVAWCQQAPRVRISPPPLEQQQEQQQQQQQQQQQRHWQPYQRQQQAAWPREARASQAVLLQLCNAEAASLWQELTRSRGQCLLQLGWMLRLRELRAVVQPLRQRQPVLPPAVPPPEAALAAGVLQSWAAAAQQLLAELHRQLRLDVAEQAAWSIRAGALSHVASTFLESEPARAASVAARQHVRRAAQGAATDHCSCRLRRQSCCTLCCKACPSADGWAACCGRGWLRAERRRSAEAGGALVAAVCEA